MSHLLAKYLPYLLLMYMMYRAAKSPVYLLGVPFLIYFKYSIFFENVKLFAVPGRLNKDVLFIIWLFIFWIIFSVWPFFRSGHKRNSPPIYRSTNRMDVIVFGMILICFVGLLIVLNEYLLIKDVFDQFFSMLSLFIGYFIVKDIVRKTNPEALKEFLYTIVIINSLASFLYIMHQGLHITLYVPPFGDFGPQQEIFQGQTVTREFWCWPVLWFFTIAYLIIFRKEKNFFNLILLIINFLAIFFSFTRSYLINGLLILFLYYLAVSYRERNFGDFVKKISLLLVVLITLSFSVYYFFPEKTEYFISRVEQLKENPTDEESNDLIFRFNQTGDVLRRIDPDKRIVGMGPVTESQVKWVSDVDAVTADMAWAGVVFRWGYLGLAFIALLYIISIIKAFRLFKQSDGIMSQLALLMSLTIISQVIESFVSVTFMGYGRSAMGLWYFGVLSALLQVNKQYKNEVAFNGQYQLS